MNNPVTTGIFTIYTTKLMEPNFVLSLMKKCDRLVLAYNEDGSVRAELIDMIPQQTEPQPEVVEEPQEEVVEEEHE